MSGNGRAMGSRAKRVTLAVALWLALTIACAAPVLIFTRGLPAHILVPATHAPAPGMSTPAPATLPRSPGTPPGHPRGTPGARGTQPATVTQGAGTGASSPRPQPHGSAPAPSSPSPHPQPPSRTPQPSPQPSLRPSLPVVKVSAGPSGVCARIVLKVCIFPKARFTTPSIGGLGG